MRAESGVEALGRGSHPPLHYQGSGECFKFPHWGPGQSPATQRFSHTVSALDGISSSILAAFCTKKLYTVQRGKGSVRFLEATWNSNCHSTLHQVQLANAQRRYYTFCSYTSARKKLWLPMGVLTPCIPPCGKTLVFTSVHLSISRIAQTVFKYIFMMKGCKVVDFCDEKNVFKSAADPA